MSENNLPDLGDGAQVTEANNLLLRREIARRAQSAIQTSPPALEATLAAISAEVMAEARDRLKRLKMQ